MRTSTIALSVVGFFSFACLSYAQEPVEKKSFNYSEWTKGLFAEAVTITGLAGAKAIYLGGIGAEEETGKPGEIRGAGDIAGQCAYTFEKISRALGKNEAKLKDIVKMTSYLTSSDYIGPYIGCRNAHSRLPAHNFLLRLF